jgi:hypothetical protein
VSSITGIDWLFIMMIVIGVPLIAYGLVFRNKDE